MKLYCQDVQASPDALVPYNIPIPAQQTDAAILRERNPDFSLETQYLHHTNRVRILGGGGVGWGVGGWKVIHTRNMALSSYPAQPY